MCSLFKICLYPSFLNKPGGWLRAFEIGCAASLEPYKGEKAKVLGRHDIADYFYQSMLTLDIPVRQKPHIQELTAGLSELRDMLDVPEEKVFTEDEVRLMKEKVSALIAITDPSRKRKPAGPPVANSEASEPAPAGGE